MQPKLREGEYRLECINPTKSLTKGQVYNCKIITCFCGNNAGDYRYRQSIVVEINSHFFVNVSPKRFNTSKL